ncbi:MAG: VWA domain-containing protein [Acidobacteria bacterium]|nr:VWA domain-containing protein [Acidobacteriota bacterium]
MKKVLFTNLLIAGVLLSALFVTFTKSRAVTPPDSWPELAPSPTPNVINTSSNQKTLELVFAIDTTGSMGGLIEGAKQRVWGIVNEVMQSSARPRVRVGLVAYRDRGDQYVTQITPLTEDLDAVYSRLMDFRADGGGDTPENVRRALADAVHKAGWAQQSNNVAQILFLVGDAPPHEDYQDEPDAARTVQQARQRDIVVNTIQCGNLAGTRPVWETIAQTGQGQYFSIAQDGGVAVITTPYDDKLGALSNQMGGTYMTYGAGEVQASNLTRQADSELKILAGAASAAKADRALNKAVNSRAYDGDLLQEVENGRLKLEEVKEAELPAELKTLSATDRKKEVDKRLAERQKLRDEITQLSKQRAEYLEVERKKQKQPTGFDAAVSAALKAQLAKKGIR